MAAETKRPLETENQPNGRRASGSDGLSERKPIGERKGWFRIPAERETPFRANLPRIAGHRGARGPVTSFRQVFNNGPSFQQSRFRFLPHTPSSGYGFGVALTFRCDVLFFSFLFYFIFI